MPTNEPEFGSAEMRPSRDVYIESVESYLNALRFQNYLGIEAMGEVIESIPSPFADHPKLKNLSMELARSWPADEADKGRVQTMREESFAIILRSYVYQENRIDTGLIYSTATAIGVDEKWLRNNLRPTPQLLFQKRVHTADRKHVRRHGHEAVAQLGLVPLYGKWLMKIMDARL